MRPRGGVQASDNGPDAAVFAETDRSSLVKRGLIRAVSKS